MRRIRKWDVLEEPRAIDLSVTGGTLPYSYSWSNGSTGEDLTGLLAGTYEVTVTDGNSCTMTLSITITEPSALTLSETHTEVGCFGGATGAIDLSVTGGTLPYSYSWSNGSTGEDLTGLLAGTYDITVTDGNSCTATLSITITEPSVLTLSETHTEVGCFGGATGAIDLSVTGGTLPYSYSWSNGSTGEDLTGLLAGTYEVTVTDGNSCTMTLSITITEPSALTLSETHTEVGCFGGATGAIDLSVTGGTVPFSYSWSNGSTSEDLTGLLAGTYEITVTDGNSCTATLSITITEPSALTLSETHMEVGCFGGATGAIDLSVLGGTLPYSYSWSNGSTVEDLGSLTTGTYTVTVTDGNSCMATLSITITEPSALILSETHTEVGCFGDATGVIDLSVTGGTLPYTYNWSNGSTGEDLTGLGSGTYDVTVTDGNSCTATLSITIVEPSALILSETHTEVGCFGAATGAIDLSVTGGTLPYSYSWSNGSTVEDLGSLTIGTYTVTVTDGNSCTATLSITIVEPSALILSETHTEVGCFGAATGAIDLSVTDGTLPYSYSWSNGSTVEDLGSLTIGTYTVTVTDGNSCTATLSITIVEPSALTLSETHTEVGCFGAATGAIDLSVTGGTLPYSYSWSNGSTGEDLTDLLAGTYEVTVTDGNSCTAILSITITEPSALILSETHTEVGCFGGAMGAIDLSVSGGTVPYSYSWSNGSTGEDLAGLLAGTYEVTVTDGNSCTETLSITITEPSALILSETHTEVGCFGGATGAIDLSVSGGTVPYSYSWSNGSTSEDLTGLLAGTYEVTVTDGNSCTATLSITITEPSALFLSETHTEVGCFGGATGAIDLSVTGGTLPYSYNWSNGSTGEDLTGLGTGSYEVTVTDGNSCTATLSITITEPSALTLSETHTEVGCFGGATGAIDLSVTGGTLPYSYSWSNGSTVEDLGSLMIGTYTVTVTDGNSCTATLSITIVEPPALTLSETHTEVGCFGGATGAIDLSVTGGTLPYSYSWSNGSTGEDLTGLLAGTYDVTVTDGNSCTATLSITITEPSALILSETHTEVGCFGGATGAIDLSVTGGTLPYSYNWSNGSTGEDLTGLGSGTYDITVTDGNSCTATLSITITEPSALTLSETHTEVGCFGGATGAIDLSVAGGTLPYSYSWSNGSTSEDLTGLVAGTYNITVTDGNSCTATLSITITEPSALILSETHTEVGCFGGATGAIDLSVAGGTLPYSYSWSNGSTSEDLTGLVAGTYNITVADGNSCTATLSITITEPSALTLSETHTEVGCFGAATGAIDLSVTGGTLPYSYNWSNGSTGEDLTGLGSGTYDITVTDGNSCTVTLSITITEPSALTLSETHTEVGCFGGATGAIDLGVTGGTLPYSYSWSNGSTGEDLTGLLAGTYDVTVTDGNSCTAILSITITEPSALILSETHTEVGCFGGATGAIDLSVTGGTLPYSFSWSNGSTSEDLTGLLTGTYDITVTDGNSCTVTLSITITEPSALTLSETHTEVGCFGGATGAIDMGVTGGTLPYSYSWSNSSTGEDLTGLLAGTYEVTVTDGNNCIATLSIVIVEPSALTLSETHTEVGCFGGVTGAIDLSVTGGTLPYSYSWSNGSTGEDLTGLGSGTYDITVTDGNSCTAILSITIVEPSALILSETHTEVGCFGGATGAIDLSVTGGTLPYSYSWSNGSTSEDLTGLGSGTYDVTVTDGNSCTAILSITIVEPSALILNETHTEVGCFGAATGAIDLSVTGGTLPYSYSWSNGSTGEDLTGLLAGTYEITVIDGNSCTVTLSITIVEPSALTLSETHTEVGCFGGATGAIDLSVTGGTVPYSYSWSNGSTGEDLTGLVAGSYEVTVTDGNSCTASLSITITEPSALTLSETHTEVGCFGDATGAIDLSVSGGTLPYSYSWSNGSTGEDLTGLLAGTYDVTVTDGNSCTATLSITITEPSALILSETHTEVGCFGAAMGAIDLSVTGGTLPYSYNWSNGSTGEDLTGLGSGIYEVTVTDGNSCIAIISITIVEPSALTLSETHTEVGCFGAAMGAIDLSVTGGTLPYSYSWSNGSAGQDLTGLLAGTYEVTVTDDNSCIAIISITIVEPSALTLSETHTEVGCFGAAMGAIDLSVTGGTLPYSYSWSNGSTGEDLTGLLAGTYEVTVTDDNSCIATLSITITEPSALTLSETHTEVGCFGAATGAIDLSVTGGTLPYSYSWSNGSMGEDLTGLLAGTYEITVTDGNSCTASLSITITEPSALILSETQTEVGCFGGATGAIDLSVTGGTLPYTYSWSNGSTGEDLTGLVAGTYEITVTDINSCTASLSITITEQSALILSETHTEVGCFGGATGAIDLGVTGGTLPYSYNWSNGSTGEDLTGLLAGTYEITVTDGNSCTATLSITIVEPSALILSETHTEVGCFGAATGAIDLSVTGGTLPYSYSWSNGSTGEDLTGLVAGSYEVTVTDINSCTATISITIVEPSALILSETHTEVGCFGGATGAIDLSATGGTLPYTYSWSNGSTGEDLTGLVSGTYDVTVTDGNSCMATLSITIVEPSALTLSETHTEVGCFGAATGAIDLGVTGGTLPYSYSWSNGSTVEDLGSLTTGTYTVTVTDGNNCTATLSITIVEPSALTLSETHTEVGCFGAATGAIDLGVTGGTLPYSYNWSNGSTGEDLTGLLAGTYEVTVTDSNSCTATLNITIVEPSALTLSETHTEVGCFGAATGAIDLSVTGGTLPYSYSWSNGSTGEDLGSLTIGTYTVTVTDGNSCMATLSITITEPSALILSETHTEVGCFGGTTGAIDLNVTGGTLPYTYSWSNGSAGQDLTGLLAGTYDVTVTDGNSCTAILSITITEPSALILSETHTEVGCFGAATGAIVLSVTGGTLPYNYNWSNGSTVEDLGSLTTGTYTVTVTDGNNCIATLSITIVEPSALTLSEAHTEVGCFGAATGAIDLSVTGGTLPYSYSWSNGSTGEDLTGLVAGTYNITVTDGNSCTETLSIVIVEPSALTLSETHTEVGCFGGATGAIDLSVTGGTLPYTYSWSNGSTGEDLTGLVAGTYEITVTDINSCTATISITIVEPSALTLSETHTEVGCFGAATGAIDLSVTGGTLPYSYSWSNGSTGEDLTGLVAGTYEITVTDSNSCTATLNITIVEPSALTLSETHTEVGCFGAATGAIDLSVTGGTLPYSYSWSNGSTGEDLGSLTIGTYTVTVTDGNSCMATLSITITEPSALILSETHTEVGCFGAATGAIVLSVTGGTLPYSYSWSNGSTGEDLGNLTIGTYTVTVTDGNSCTATSSITITEPSALTLSETHTEVGCFGGTTGAIDLNVTGGTLPYSYSWSNGSAGQDLTGLLAGTYEVTVTDGNSCTAILSITITEPSALILSETHTEVGCFGGATGAIDLSVTGGTLPYSYSWSNGSTSEDLIGLVAGTYEVTVTDGNSCTATLSITITEPSALILSETHTEVGCFGAATGAIDLSVTGGTLPYSYSWSNGSTGEDLTGLLAGTYEVTVTDGNSCTATLSITITEPSALILSETHTEVGCFGVATGAIDLSVTGGTLPYSYSWSNGSTGEDLTGLVSGTYDVTVTDGNSCTATLSITITEPSALILSETHTEVGCFGAATGAIDLSVTGGPLPYSYSWSNGSTSEDLTGLVAGTYEITVTDGNSCTATLSITIVEPSALTLSETHTEVGCFGGTTGAIDLNVTGGTLPYTYSWSNGSAGQDLTGLLAGTYEVTVTDGNSCTAILSITITEPSALTLSETHTEVGCFGAATGAIDLSVIGGTLPYSYSWSNGSTGEDLTGLGSGTYEVTVTDGNSCTATLSINITEPSALILSETHTEVGCFGGATGAIDLSVSGGTLPYSYSWSNGSTGEDLTGLLAGTYEVTVTDGNSCTATLSINITEPSALILSETHTEVGCFGAATGAIDLSATGGTLPYSYSWSNGSTGEDLTGLGTGSYQVTVTDGNNCTATLSITIVEPSALTLSETHTEVGCFGAATGAIDLGISGGTLPYSYNWSNGSTGEDLTGLLAGTYEVTVTDGNSCTATLSITITEPSALILSETHTEVGCFGGATGAIDLSVTGGTLPYSYSWSNGSTGEDLTGLVAGTYEITVTDGNSCTASLSITITEPSALILSETQTEVGCFGAATGAIDLSVTGGTLPYSYNWSNGSTGEDLTGLVSGTYDVTVTDGNSCMATLSITITEPSALILSETHTEVGCFGAATGAIDLSVTGGTLPYTYSWSNGSTGEDLTGLLAGTYEVTVTDGNSCMATLSITITEPSALILSETHTEVGCFGGATGAIDLSVTGGTLPYSYSWSNGSTGEDLTGLLAGTYEITVTDGNSCTATLSIVITEPSALTLSETHTEVGCFGGATGAIDLSTTGGTLPYTYSWSNGSTGEDLTGLVSGTYDVTVTDGNSCIAIISITIVEPSALTLSETHTEVGCFGAATGAIDLGVTGGTLPYSYSWSNGSTVEDLGSLTTGTYTVTVTDGNNCTATLSITIVEPSALTLSETHTEVGCFGGATGAIDLSVTGGTLPYSYSWSNGSTGEDLTGLVAGTYEVTVTDGNSCTASLSITITEPSALILSETQTEVGCFGGATGAIDLSVTGGTLPYSYSWSNGSTGEDLTGLLAGTYEVTVTDGNSCTATLSINITEPSALILSETHTEVGCFGGATGAIDLSVTGGTLPYSYSWSNGSTSEDLTGLLAGTYEVTVTDGNSCTASLSITIVEPSALTLSETHTEVGCFGGATGAIDLSVMGGTLPYSYSWSNGSTGEDLTGLLAGTYEVTVTDGKSCTATLSITIVEPSALILSETHMEVGCFGDATGAIDLSVTGGTLPYTYSWSNGSTGEDLTGLGSGTYEVTVTDGNSCTATLSINITEPSALILSETQTEVGCFGGATGAIDLSVTGGTLPYSYSWSNGSTSEDLTGLLAGTYEVTVTDGNSCTASLSITITEPSALTLSETHTEVGCFGAATGAIDLSVTGGTMPYTYSWNTGAVSEDINGLGAGDYNVTVTDANGCTMGLSITLTEPAGMMLTETHTDVLCFGGLTGAIDLSVSGGLLPYTYIWNTGAVSEDLNGLGAGDYDVTVTDANGCSMGLSITLTEPAGMTLTETHTDVLCFGGLTER
ncbi:MAG: SprB repeat-containing protein [Sphingobacteriales bacterium]|nr:MAG: SprB repeat-containing protein [Sphingobacteriales bacterium]